MSIREHPLRDRLRDGALPRSGQPIQPVDGGLVEITYPELNRVDNGSTRPLETTFTAPVSILGRMCAADVV